MNFHVIREKTPWGQKEWIASAGLSFVDAQLRVTMLITFPSFSCASNAKIFPYLAVTIYKLIIFEGTCSAVHRRYPHEAANKLRNQILCGIEREMTCVEDVDFGLQHVAAMYAPSLTMHLTRFNELTCFFVSASTLSAAVYAAFRLAFTSRSLPTTPTTVAVWPEVASIPLRKWMNLWSVVFGDQVKPYPP